MYLDVATFIYKLLNLYLQDVFPFVNLFAFVRELVCIYVWIFETLLTWLDSQMHFFSNKELSVANQMPPSFSANHMTAVTGFLRWCRLLL